VQTGKFNIDRLTKDLPKKTRSNDRVKEKEPDWGSRFRVDPQNQREARAYAGLQRNHKRSLSQSQNKQPSTMSKDYPQQKSKHFMMNGCFLTLKNRKKFHPGNQTQ